MSQSQAQGSDRPVGLVFLSDNVLQIPAILTAAAWEHLQSQEERESLSSLLNTTVRFRDYRLHFHMAAEQTKCKFFLLVGILEMASAGQVKGNTPCCTTLPSVQLKICQTWRAMREQDVPESKASQSGLDLTELLGEWQLDCVQTVGEDVKERIVEMYGLGSRSPADCAATTWDTDRVRYKGEGSFKVHPGCLLIPEEVTAPQPPASNQLPGVSGAALGDPLQPSEGNVDAASWGIGKLLVLQTKPNAGQRPTCSTEEELQLEDVIVELADGSVRPLSNPWDVYPPLRTTCSSSEASPLKATPRDFRPDFARFDCSTQGAADGSKRFEKVSESGKKESSFLTPYQKGQRSPSDPDSAVSSTSVEASGSSNRPPATEELEANAAPERQTDDRKCRKRKREDVPVPPKLGEEGLVLSFSPHFSLCSTLASSQSSQDQHLWASGLHWASAKTPCVHSDGTAFSYSYSVTGQNLVDLSHFNVSDSCIRWAARYLLPPKPGR